MGTKDFRISADELDRLEIACATCGCAVVFKADVQRGPVLLGAGFDITD